MWELQFPRYISFKWEGGEIINLGVCNANTFHHTTHFFTIYVEFNSHPYMWYYGAVQKFPWKTWEKDKRQELGVWYWIHLYFVERKYMYRIHSNKRPGRLTKSFRLGAYLFQYFLKWSTPQNHIQAHPANEYG